MSNRPALACALLAACLLGACGRETPQQKKPTPAAATTGPTTRSANGNGRLVAFDLAQFRADYHELTQRPHRLAGLAEGSLAASEYVRKRLRDDYGFAEDPAAKAAMYVQSVPVVQPVTRTCELIARGKSHRIHPLRPNGLQASVTPAEGLTGQTLYAGKGTAGEYGHRSPEGRIVVLDFDCEANWRNAFAFGAKAVLFVGHDTVGPDGVLDWKGPPARHAYHHVGVPANLPRFYVPRALADQLGLTRKPCQVTIRAACEWKGLAGQNVVAVVRGTDPTFAADRPAQVMVLAAPLDSYSEVPELAPGARDAANVAALLQMAGHVKAHPPRRTVVLAFLDGECLNHMGARAFYGALFHTTNTHRDAASLEARLSMLQQEQAYVHFVLFVLERDALFEPPASDASELGRQVDALAETLRREHGFTDADLKAVKGLASHADTYHREAMRWLRAEAQLMGSRVLDLLRPIRLKLKDLQGANKAGPEVAARIAKLTARRDELAVLDLSWNSIQKVIHKQIDLLRRPELAKDLFENLSDRKLREKLIAVTPPRFRRLLALTQDVAHQRLAELDEEITRTRQGIALRTNLTWAELSAGTKWADLTPAVQSALSAEQADQAHSKGGLADSASVAVGQIVLHVSLDLGDALPRWTFIHGDDSLGLHQDKSGNYTPIFKTMRQVHRTLGAELTVDDVVSWSGLAAALRAKPMADWTTGLLSDKARQALEAVGAKAGFDPSARKDAAENLLRSLNDDVLADEDLYRRVLAAELVKLGSGESSAAGRALWVALAARQRQVLQAVARGEESVLAKAQADRVGPRARGRGLTRAARATIDKILAEIVADADAEPSEVAGLAPFLAARDLLRDPGRVRYRQDTQYINRLVLQAAAGTGAGAKNALKPAPPYGQAGWFEPRAISQIYDSRLFAPGKFADSGAAARMVAVFNVSAMTVMDRLARQGQPADTRGRLNATRVARQAEQVAAFCGVLADDAGLNVPSPIRPEARFAETQWSDGRGTGASVRRVGSGSALRAHPVRAAVVAILDRERWAGCDPTRTPPGFVKEILLRTNVNGNYEVSPFHWTQQVNGYLLAATFDDPSADPEGPQTPGPGLITAITSAGKGTTTLWRTSPIKAAIEISPCQARTLVGYGFDRGAAATMAMRALSTAQFQPDRHLVAEHGNILALFVPYDARGLKLFNKAGMVLLANRNTAKDYRGRGVSLAEIGPFDHPVVARTTAKDLRTLNEYRLDLHRNNRIHKEDLEVLNSRAKELEDLAETARAKHWANHTIDWYYGTLAAAASVSRRVYGPLVASLNDLVTAVVVLLLLAVPFAYSLERLLIGTPHIYRQIGWFTLLFLATFMLLYFVNPAFRLAATPIIIFLAFAIIVLSSLVIFIMVRKLQTEIRKVQGMGSTVHSTDVSRLSTTMAAVHMGISTMRRRPLRTVLTAVTVVLLTFTILTFASFGSRWGNRRTYKGPMSGPPRILVRHMLWSPISDEVYKMVRGHLSDEARVVPRYWVSPTAQDAKNAAASGQSLEMLLASGSCKQLTPIAAAIGLDPRDLQSQPLVKQLFESGARLDLLGAGTKAGGAAGGQAGRGDGVFLTRAVSEVLGLTDADIGTAHVMLRGVELTYAGVVSDAMAAYSLMEGTSMLPVDYQASSGGAVDSITQQEASESLHEVPDIESAQFVHHRVDQVVIVSPEVARRMGGRVRAITIYPADPDKANLQAMADELATMTELPTYVGDAGGVHRLIFTSLTQASGWHDLLIPVVLGGLIVFATMLGSVSDREKEIYTFSSLGLAPPHVASLFFAEAGVYAVVGGMGGYLLGQVTARVVSWLAGDWGFSLNYSSTNAIVTILIVMGTVLISTIYPAVKASRSANPGIQRAWKIPAPEGNLYDLVFPFTVSAYDITGVVSFLAEHFDNCSDTSLGVFATTECHIFREADKDMLGLRAEVALAPFDLGVNQTFAMVSQPSEIEGIDEVRILITRLSGAHGDWRRGNRVFINDLRKQLLIWRSLPSDVMETYRQRTLAVYDQLPRERPESEGEGEGDAQMPEGDQP